MYIMKVNYYNFIKYLMRFLYNIILQDHITRTSDFKLTCAFHEEHFHTCEKKYKIAVKQ